MAAGNGRLRSEAAGESRCRRCLPVLVHPPLVLPAAIVVAMLMAGALAMHLKVGDPFKKSLPALSVLILCAIIIAGRWPAA